MTEIKVNKGNLRLHQQSFNTANLNLPSSAKLKGSKSTGAGFNELKAKVKDTERLVSQYATLLAQDVAALGNVARDVGEADKKAASALRGGK